MCRNDYIYLSFVLKSDAYNICLVGNGQRIVANWKQTTFYYAELQRNYKESYFTPRCGLYSFHKILSTKSRLIMSSFASFAVSFLCVLLNWQPNPFYDSSSNEVTSLFDLALILAIKSRDLNSSFYIVKWRLGSTYLWNLLFPSSGALTKERIITHTHRQKEPPKRIGCHAFLLVWWS